MSHQMWHKKFDMTINMDTIGISKELSSLLI